MRIPHRRLTQAGAVLTPLIFLIVETAPKLRF